MNKVGPVLKDFMDENSVSRAAVASELGCSQSFVSDVARGHRLLSDERIVDAPHGALRDAVLVARIEEYEERVSDLKGELQQSKSRR